MVCVSAPDWAQKLLEITVPLLFFSVAVIAFISNAVLSGRKDAKSLKDSATQAPLLGETGDISAHVPARYENY